MSQQKSSLELDVCELYYQLRKSQKEVSIEKGISVSTVSRLLQSARDRGVVKIVIDPPSNVVLARNVAQAVGGHGIREVLVSPTGRKSVGVSAARYFEDHIEELSVVVLDGGLTVRDFVDSLVPGNESIGIVPIATDPPSYEVSAYELMTRMSIKYPSSQCHKLPYSLKNLLNRRHEAIRRKARTARFLVLGVGPWKRRFTALDFVYHLGVKPEEIRRSHSAIVAVCGYCGLSKAGTCLPINGIDKQMRRALFYEELQRLAGKTTCRSVLLAAGKNKYSATMAAIRARLCNVLIVDDELAVELAK